MPASRLPLLAASAVLALGAAAHLAIIGIGPPGFAAMGAPADLVALAGTASPRPAISCIAIACVLAVAALYGLSAAGLGPRLPGRRPIAVLIGIGLVARGVLMPLAIAWHPESVAGICGNCQSLNGFVLGTSALCLLVGLAYACGTALPRSAVRS